MYSDAFKFLILFTPMPLNKEFSQKSDAELILYYKSSEDLGVLGELYTRYMSLVFGTCLKYLKDREESKDAAMQIFEKLVETLKDHEVLQFKSWLYVTTRNHCLMQLRQKKSKGQIVSDDFMENELILHLEEEPDNEFVSVKLEKCIEELINEQKYCVQLFYLQQKCYKEIVQQTGFDDNKVKSYIQNGKRNLKICMERNA
jgi:RNA polymerase sigma factor (sigma-70 family)